MTNDGKFWGPVCDGERIVAWTRGDTPVPGAVEALRDGVPQRFLRFRDGAVVRLSEAERKEILDAEAAEEAQRAEDAAAAAAVAAAQREAEAAADALAPRDVQIGKATLRTYPDGSVELLSGPLILPGTASGAYELWVDSATGLVLTTLDHASPRKSKAEKDAAKAAKTAKVAAVKAAGNDKAKLDALLDLLGLK
jgi:hypothetical protein